MELYTITFLAFVIFLIRVSKLKVDGCLRPPDIDMYSTGMFCTADTLNATENPPPGEKQVYTHFQNVFKSEPGAKTQILATCLLQSARLALAQSCALRPTFIKTISKFSVRV